MSRERRSTALELEQARNVRGLSHYSPPQSWSSLR